MGEDDGTREFFDARCADSGPIGSEEWLQCACDVGRDLLDAGIDTSNSGLVNRAVAALSEALEWLPDEPWPSAAASPAGTRLLNARAGALLERYLYHGHRLDDLDGSLRDARFAVEQSESNVLAPDLPSQRGWYAFTLANALAERAAVTRAPSDLDEAVGRYKDALGVATGPARRAQYQAALALSLIERFNLAQGRPDLRPDPGDLDRAVNHLQAALRDTPRGDQDLVGRTNNLGGVLLDRYEHGGEVEDLATALSCCASAVEHGNPDDGARPIHLANLAHAYQLHHEAGRSSGDRAEATRWFRAACTVGFERRHPATVSTARRWAVWAAGRGAWKEAAEAGEAGLEALKTISAHELRRHYKEVRLREGNGLAAEAAYALCRRGQLESAVLALEENRAVVLSDRFPNVRAHLETLRDTGHSDLEHLYRRTTSKLTDDDASYEDLATARRELDRLTTQVRAIAGLEGFREATSFAHVANAAQALPLVYVAAASRGGVALIVRGDATVEPVRLDRLTAEATANAVEHFTGAVHSRAAGGRQRRRAIDEMCEWLGRVCMSTISAALGGSARQL